MKATALLFVLTTAAATTAFGTPCWSQSDDCGNMESCPLYIPPPPGALEAECYHTYCDGDQLCSSDYSKKSMMSSDRIMYAWPSGSGNVWYTCLSAATITPSYNCCLCAVPGTVYPTQAE